MKTRVQKWGNCLAVRLPKSFAEEAGIKENAPIDFTLRDGVVLIEPIAEPSFALGELIEGITEQNLHREVGTGPAVGNEAW